MLMHVPPEQYIDTLVGSVPKGSRLSYRAVEYEKTTNREELSWQFPALLLSIIGNAPCVLDIDSEEQHAKLSKLTLYWMKHTLWSKPYASNHYQQGDCSHRLEGSPLHVLVVFCCGDQFHLSICFLRQSSTLLYQHNSIMIFIMKWKLIMLVQRQCSW